MNRLKNAKISFSPNLKAKTPSKTLSLWDLLIMKEETFKPSVEALRRETDEKQQAKLKEALPVFTPSGVFKTFDEKGLVQHSGFICVDIDKKDNTHLRNFDKLKTLIARVPEVAFCAHSTRGEGYFVLIPISHPERHKEHFRALQSDFSRCGIVIDGACSNISRKRFVSYDDSPYINTGALVYDRVQPDGAKPQRIASMPEETKGKYLKCVALIESAKLDVTGSYTEWFDILCAIANDLGEEGREVAHNVSKYYSGYTPEETDKKFDDALRAKLPFDVGTLIYHLERAQREHSFDSVEIDNI